MNFPRSPAFAQLATISGDPNHGSAALLHAALSKRTIQGTAFGSDDGLGGSQGDITLGTVSCRVYMDSWKNPIGFRRL